MGSRDVPLPYFLGRCGKVITLTSSFVCVPACVSPADVNQSETVSTLHYANRARNIRNKPVKNTDSVKEELRCLRQMAHFLKVRLFRPKAQPVQWGVVWFSSPPHTPTPLVYMPLIVASN